MADERDQESSATSNIQNEYRRIQTTLARYEFESRMAQLTQQELSNFPSHQSIYRPLGKAFVLTDLTTVRSSLEKVVIKSQVEGEKLRQRKSELESSITASQT